ncbi:TPA: hypothetical protein ACJ509_003238, partial [Stenotrophomonas maltophilia]
NEALVRTQGVVVHAAQLLGLRRTTLMTPGSDPSRREGSDPTRSQRGRSPFRWKGIRPLCICT